MLDAFWSTIGKELARTWIARVLTPAFAFWVAGLGLLWWDRNATAVRDRGWGAAVAATADPVVRLPVAAQVGIVVGALLVLTASALIAERLTLPVLRLLEGYWPARLVAPLVRRRRRLRNDAQQRVNQIVRKRDLRGLELYEHVERLNLSRSRNRNDAEQRRLGELEAKTTALPPVDAAALLRDTDRLESTPEPDEMMPTRLGDVLRAAERRPLHTYGIDGVCAWSALWLMMPADTRQLLGEARASLDAAARSWLWGALFLVWAFADPWAIIVAVVVPLLVYRFAILPRALTFGSLVVTAYDLHRIALYDAMHLHRPLTPDRERAVDGPALTNALAGHPTAALTYRTEPVPAAASTPRSGAGRRRPRPAR
ncbi:MAG: hypothetical protein ACR2GH_14805 [Pseudonocardia sp.]